MGYVLQFKVPGVPLSLNKVLRMNFRRRDAYYKRWYSDIALIVGSNRPPRPLERAHLSFTRHAPRTLDYDGCAGSMKPLADALQHCGVIINDSWKVTRAWSIDQVYTKTGSEFVTIRVEEIIELAA
jgi:hypothetical protein